MTEPACGFHYRNHRFKQPARIILSMCFNLILMQAHIGAARLITTLSAGQIIRGIQGLTLGAGIMCKHGFKPPLNPVFPDLFLVLPQFDAVRPGCLKFC